MALIACPDCGNKISDAAPACIHCGRPVGQGGSTIPSSPAKHLRVPSSPVRSSYTCPKCGSEEVKKLSIVHASGFSNLQSQTLMSGVGIGGGEIGIGMGTAVTSGTQQTSLSTSVAPPAQRKPRSGPPAAWGCGTIIVGTIIAVAAESAGVFEVALLIGLIIWAVMTNSEQQAAKRWNQAELPHLKEKWDRSVMCLRCGNVWEIAGAA
jgi:DNA-directed RNA polymerase subunit RPC12/RpoP